MDSGAGDPKVREALAELQLYLSDAVAPLVVSESLEMLLEVPPQIVAQEIAAWTTSQHRRLGGSVPVSEYLYHSIRKLYMMGELTLLPKAALETYLTSLQPFVIEFCPPDDREVLRDNLAHLADAQSDFVAPVLAASRQRGGEARSLDGTPTTAKPTAHVEQRFADLVDRLARLPVPATAPSEARGEMASQLLSVAARNATDPAQFRKYKARLRDAGMGSAIEDVFRSLGRRLPGWALPAVPEGQAAPLTATVQAMQRIITLEQDPREAARRFQELVQAAIEQHNEGSLPRAVTMLDLAGALVAEKKVDPAYVQAFREQAHEKLDAQRLRQLAEDPAWHLQLRRLLVFFPALSPESMLASVQTEERREQRRLLLSLLEVHGASARALAASRLESSTTSFGDRDALFQRNLLHILRRIPRPAEVAIDQELQTAIQLSAVERPVILAKEAIAYLGQAKDERAERALIARVGEYEAALTRPSGPTRDAGELLALLDRAVFALARIGSPAARRAVVHHGLNRAPQLGDTTARLAPLGTVDLSSDPELIEQLVQAVHDELPRRIFGFTLKRDEGPAVALIETLASTPAPAARNLLADIVQHFPGERLAQAAAKALAGAEVSAAAVAAPAAAAASLSGDLDLFGLPTLLQNLSQSGTTGTLSIRGTAGEEIASVDLEGGKFRSCRAGRLTDELALYQLIERPVPASFTFVSHTEASPPVDPKLLHDLVPLFFEGTRRYDEFQQAAALVPDYAALRATKTKPTAPPEEDDQGLMRTIWQRAASGLPALECEVDLSVDSYRARRILAHWVEEGALEPR